VKLSDSELKHLEELAKLKLEGESRQKLRIQLSRIIDFVRKLQEVDTSGYEARAYVGRFKPYLRPDEPEECLPRDKVLEESPDTEKGQFRVPPIIETE